MRVQGKEIEPLTSLRRACTAGDCPWAEEAVKLCRVNTSCLSHKLSLFFK